MRQHGRVASQMHCEDQNFSVYDVNVIAEPAR